MKNKNPPDGLTDLPPEGCKPVVMWWPTQVYGNNGNLYYVWRFTHNGLTYEHDTGTRRWLDKPDIEKMLTKIKNPNLSLEKRGY
jgi:hypothetical protein